MTILTLGVSLFAFAIRSDKVTTLQQSAEQGIYQRDSTNVIEGNLNRYLNGEENSSILTPGETADWKVKLQSGQVIIADARSAAFDPGLQIVNDKGSTVSESDDRYPGDQRPLVFWRCDQDGEYIVRARCFRDKAGGRVGVRFNTYETIDVISETPVEKYFDATRPFLARIPMKAGQIKDLVAERRGQENFLTFNFDTVISPIGLPEKSPSLATSLSPAIQAIVAPVDGDYYVLGIPYGYSGGSGRIRVSTRDFVAKNVPLESGKGTSVAAKSKPALWEINVKSGDFLEITAEGMQNGCRFVVGEAPDISKLSLAKAETNPFFPKPKTAPADPAPPIDVFTARERDTRMQVFRANRDAKLWVALEGVIEKGDQYELKVRPAATAIATGAPNAGKLRIANTDYWSFEAQAGDVMTFNTSTTGFSQVLTIRDPDLQVIRQSQAELDQTTDVWQMVLQKPGRYIVSVSCAGSGGCGDYRLSRTVLSAQEFGLAKPAKGDIAPGQTQIWKFTAKPDEPVLIQWNSSKAGYNIAVFDGQGRPSTIPLQDIDEHTKLGILKVGQAQTFVIVLTGGSEKATYSISMDSIRSHIKK